MSTVKHTNRPFLWRLPPAERRVVLILGDVLVSGLALLISLYFWGARDNWLDFSLTFLRERPPYWFYLLPVGWFLLLVELYDLRRAGRRKDTLAGVALAALAGLGVYLLVFFLSPKGSLPRFSVAVFIIAETVLTLAWRFTYISVFSAPQFLRRVLIVGAGRAGSTLATVIKEIWPPPFYLTGLIDDDPQKIGTEVAKVPVLGGCRDLMRIVQEQQITDLILAISGEMKEDLFEALINAEEKGLTVKTMPIVYEELLGRVPIFLLQSDWILRSFFDHVHASEFYEALKRLLDIVGSLVGGLFFLLFLPVGAMAILLDDGFPIFYTQERLGKSGDLYKIIKFRTMRKDAERDGRARMATENDQRVTWVGRILRKSHLDELPQFINVLRGDMSLVGPRAERPELVDELQEHVPFYRARLLVKPGLTGWAQVNFGYASNVADTGVKLEYDLYYIKHRNLLLDFLILVRTVGTVIGLRGQ